MRLVDCSSSYDCEKTLNYAVIPINKFPTCTSLVVADRWWLSARLYRRNDHYGSHLMMTTDEEVDFVSYSDLLCICRPDLYETPIVLVVTAFSYHLSFRFSARTIDRFRIHFALPPS